MAGAPNFGNTKILMEAMTPEEASPAPERQAPPHQALGLELRRCRKARSMFYVNFTRSSLNCSPCFAIISHVGSGAAAPAVTGHSENKEGVRYYGT